MVCGCFKSGGKNASKDASQTTDASQRQEHSQVKGEDKSGETRITDGIGQAGEKSVPTVPAGTTSEDNRPQAPGGILKKRRSKKLKQRISVNEGQENQQREAESEDDGEEEAEEDEDPSDGSSSEQQVVDEKNNARETVAEIEFEPEKDPVEEDDFQFPKINKSNSSQNKMRIKDSVAVSKFKKNDIVLGESVRKSEGICTEIAQNSSSTLAKDTSIRDADLAREDAWKLFEGNWIMTRVENMNGVYRASGYGLQEMSAWKDTNFGVGSLGVTISIPDKNKVTLGFETEEKDYTQELTLNGVSQTVPSYWGDVKSISRWLSPSSFQQKTTWKDEDITLTYSLRDSGNCLEQKFSLLPSTNGLMQSSNGLNFSSMSMGLGPLIQAVGKRGVESVGDTTSAIEGVQLYSLMKGPEEQ